MEIPLLLDLFRSVGFVLCFERDVLIVKHFIPLLPIFAPRINFFFLLPKVDFTIDAGVMVREIGDTLIDVAQFKIWGFPTTESFDFKKRLFIEFLINGSSIVISGDTVCTRPFSCKSESRLSLDNLFLASEMFFLNFLFDLFLPLSSISWLMSIPLIYSWYVVDSFS